MNILLFASDFKTKFSQEVHAFWAPMQIMSGGKVSIKRFEEKVY
jgi:hypothetical protein